METIYAVKLGGAMCAGITSQSMNLGAQLDKEPTDGSPYYTNVVLTGVDPRVSFATNQPTELLSAVGVAGSAISTGGLVLYLWQYSTSSARSSSGRSITCNSGLIVPRTLQCQARQNATFECEALLTSPDGNCPWDVGGDSVPSYTDGGKYGVRNVSLSGSASADNVNGFTLDFGIQTIADYGVGDYCAKAQYIQQFDPKLTLTSSQAGWVSSDWDGEEVTASITLGKRTATAQFESGSDFTVICHGIWTLDSMFNGSGNSPANSSATITLTKSGSTLPIVLGSASAPTPGDD